ncbi:ATP-binding cassette domain-containing protein [Brevibacterium luteolum]|uniref:ATP-binding cassette domain-containing protein n=1 Tax=Brevibacterium luteolum TaxID=199591 RepID=UPI0021AF58A0|nr:ATP-binding cassette domain-containing protein [Brevibacterium luteolum]MCT1873274.1 ATP-binding cassette domain-containing protein [Brevibacterium luteolum]MCT1889921.1 ATP-binding cassette domain-containing protein [Brevibacterium luteolum]MCT1892323.1 ATP-binding cassette domain-containing protein [Brevibacterium luteolum]MCT1923600.1 ATP-binding cassette domain-containing protein [Brevibacterium luteolum]
MSDLAAVFRLPARGLRIDIAVPNGSTTALIGPNGAGKSTTFDVLSGLLTPPEAEITLGARPIMRTTGRKVRVPSHKRGIVQLAQAPLLFPTMTVVDNVAFALRCRGVARREARSRAASMLERVDLAGMEDRRPHQLSGGQAQRAAIARAAIAEPDLLLLDEPMSALDRDSVPHIRALLTELLGDATALLISHDRADVEALADRVVVLDQGAVVQAGSTAEAVANPVPGFAARFFS